jgi:hypothetical protein
VNKWILFFICQSAIAAGPVLTELQPRGAQQGKTFTLTLQGRDLPTAGAKIVSTMPAVFTPMTAPMGKGLPFLVEPKGEVPVGTYPIRIETAQGISNVLLFTVGSFPEIDEEEKNDSIATAQVVKSTPVTINGTLTGADRDFFRVSGKAGERRVFEVEARRCGSAIDPVIELVDSKGLLLARNEDAPGIGVDARLDYTFPHEGEYIVMIHDARFSKQEQNFYRLKMGAYTYAESMFPLGGQRGQTVQVEFVSKSGAQHASVKIPAEGSYAEAAMPGSPTLPFRLAVSDYPEVMAPVQEALKAPVVVNGRIAKPAEVDRFHLAVSPGEAYLFELQSRELEASQLDALLTVYDAKGKKLVSAGDTPPPVDVFAVNAVARTSGDPFLNFKVPEDVHEITVAVEDIAQRGGPDFGYRLTVRKQAEDFRLSAAPAYVNVPRGGTALIAVNVERRGYDGPIHATIHDLPKGWTVDGGYIAEESMDAANLRSFSRRAVLTLTVAPDAELPQSDLVVEAEAKLADGTVLKRRATGLGVLIDVAGGTGLPDPTSSDRQKPFTATWLGMGMPSSITKEPPATLEVRETGHTQMPEGDAYKFAWKVVTKNKMLQMPANINADAPGVRDIRVIDVKAASKGADNGTFTITTTRATTPAVYDLVISANLLIDGQRETITSRAIPFEVLKGTSDEGSTKVTSGSR